MTSPKHVLPALWTAYLLRSAPLTRSPSARRSAPAGGSAGEASARCEGGGEWSEGREGGGGMQQNRCCMNAMMLCKEPSYV